MPKVSICIPSYNGARFIAQAIESGLAQTMADLEVVVVDDGSTDNTVEIANEYSASDSRVRVYRNAENLGLPGNWDRCRALASGEWVMFLFQDDLFRPDCAEQMLSAAINHSAQLVCCKREFDFSPEIPEETRVNFLSYPKAHNLARFFPHKTFVSAREFRDQLVLTPTVNFIGEPTAVLLRRDTLEMFGRFHPAMMQLVDFEYWVRIAVRKGLAHIEEPLVTFRVHGNSATTKNSQSIVREDRLDSIILLHDYLHAPAYRDLRSSIRHRTLLLKQYARRIDELKQGVETRDPQDPTWEAALKRYPELEHAGAAAHTAELVYRFWQWNKRPSAVGFGGRTG